MHLRGFLFVSSLGFAASVSAFHPVHLESGHLAPQNVRLPRDDENLQTLEDRDFKNRCGPGVGKCADGYCCSVSGYCGKTKAHCRSPDCLIDYGNCDAHIRPDGPSTKDVPRTQVGKIPYGPSVIRSCSVPGTVALTYDDGPYKYTGELLNLLDKYEAKVTFFVTGINNGKGELDDPKLPWASLIHRMKGGGHQIASHSWSHQDFSKISKEFLSEQILNNEAALRNILGYFPTYMRPPYASCNQGCLDELGALGYHIVLYDIDTSDYLNDNPGAIQKSKDIFDRALAPWKADDKSWLVIAHDVHEQTVHNLTEHMLKRLKSSGYKAVTVGECLGDPEENWYRFGPTPNSTSTDAVPTKTSTPNKAISTDGQCGENVTCIGSTFGSCCSLANFCGNSAQHCGVGCQLDFGRCHSNSTSKSTFGTNTKSASGSGSNPANPTHSEGGKKDAKSEASSFHMRTAAMLLSLIAVAVMIVV